VISTDFYPTILEATGQSLRPHQHVDGVSLVSLLSGGKELPREAIYWHYPHYNRHPSSFPSSVVRSGDWKLIESLEDGQLFLFNLRQDLGETKNRADDEPTVVADLTNRLERWRSNVGADPMKPNPEYQFDQN
jgi:arylsulfatase A-like enzyme